jgi:hypothetical protein
MRRKKSRSVDLEEEENDDFGELRYNNNKNNDEEDENIKIRSLYDELEGYDQLGVSNTFQVNIKIIIKNRLKLIL